MVSRRGVIRVLGTSAVILAAGGVGLSQCDPMPEAAVEAWKGPAPDVKDPRVRSLSYALLAPNPHNMQPWIADLREAGAITLVCDRTRLLPETDPNSRQIVIGCGAFLEMLRMAAAAQGFRVEVTAFPQGEWPENAVGDQPLCRIAFVADQTLVRDPLLTQAFLRRTNRGAYDAAPPSTQQFVAVAAAMSDLPVTFGWTSSAAQLAKLRDIAKRAWAVEVGKDATYFESIKVFRITGEEIAKHRDGLSFHGPLFWWLNAAGLFSRERGMSRDAFMRQQTLENIDPQLAGSPAFAWIVTTTNDRRAQLASGAAYLRANLAATSLGLGMQPLSQALQEFPEMLPLLAEHKRALALPDSDTVQMFFRIGRASPVEPAPRRKLGDIVSA